MTKPLDLRAGDITDLPPQAPQFEQSYHHWSEAEIDALTLAHAARRPLLVRGEPGIGKTQIARAIAVHWDWMLHAVTIHPRYEPQHLIARLDAVRRLADAQSRSLQPDHQYWTPGPIWCAFDWQGAQPFLRGANAVLGSPADPKGHVILIDEIDKADSDLPNGLLELLGQRAFEFAPLGLKLGGPGTPLPLVIITSNDERDLPAAFVRRCVVLNLAATGNYQEWLIERGRVHYQYEGRRLDEAVLLQAARQLVDDREKMEKASLAPPGAAEYLDLLAAVHELAPGNTVEQMRLLNKLSRYVFVKHSDKSSPLQQDRPALEPGAG